MDSKYKTINHFLTGRSGWDSTLESIVGQQSYRAPLVSSGQKSKGIYISSHTIFENSKLEFGVYVRNTLDRNAEVVKGVKRSIKLSFLRGVKAKGSNYLTYPKSNNESDFNAVELDTGMIAKLANLLDGCEVTEFSVTALNGSFCKITGSSQELSLSIEAGGSPLTVSFDLESIFLMRMLFIEYCLLLFPDVSPEITLKQLMASVKSGSIAGGSGHANNTPSDVIDNDGKATPINMMENFSNLLKRVVDRDSLELAIEVCYDEPVTEKTRNQLWAIGNQKLGLGQSGLTTIQFIQNISGEALARGLAYEANKGDASMLKRIHSIYNAG